jgi:hypothetical protein
MSRELPRTVDEAIDLYLRERAKKPSMLPISDRYEVLRWFFDAGKASGLHNAVKHLGSHVGKRTRTAR